MTSVRALLLFALVLGAGVSACRGGELGAACEDHLTKRRACAAQLGGPLGDELTREGERLRQLWTVGAIRLRRLPDEPAPAPANSGTKPKPKPKVPGDQPGTWSDRWGPKWCAAATAEARLTYPDCAW